MGIRLVQQYFLPAANPQARLFGRIDRTAVGVNNLEPAVLSQFVVDNRQAEVPDVQRDDQLA